MSATGKEHDTGYLKKGSRVYGYNKLLIAVVVGFFCLKLWDSYTLSSLKDDWEALVIPPYAKESQWMIGRDQASENYLVDMAHYIVHLWGNVTPLNVEDKYNILLSLVHEKQYPSYKLRLTEVANEIKRFTSISHYMDLQSRDAIFIEKNQITVNVRRYKVTGSALGIPIDASLVIDFVVEGGRFKIVNLEEKS